MDFQVIALTKEAAKGILPEPSMVSFGFIWFKFQPKLIIPGKDLQFLIWGFFWALHKPIHVLGWIAQGTLAATQAMVVPMDRFA